MDRRDERAGGSRRETPAARTLPVWLQIVCLGVIAALLVGSGAVAASAQQPPFLEAGRLFAPDGLSQEHFGHAVALDGNTLAVGAPSAKVGVHPDQGAVYVYVRAASGWTLQQQLTAADGDANDQFGYSVAVRGDVIVAGAPYDTVAGNNNQGSAYVFRRTVGTWAQEARITGPGAATDRFGWAVDLSGTTVAVGAPYEGQIDLPNSGAVHVFSGATSLGGDRTWTATARLTASDAARADHFGYSVALAGDTLLAGTPHRDDGHKDEGRVYAYARSGSAWIERQRLDAPNPDGDDHFGSAVALDGTDAIVGAPGRDGAERDQGAAFAFAYAAGLWVHAETLTLPAGAESGDARFGAAAAVDAGLLAVGAPGTPETSRVRRDGDLHTFEGGQGAWTPHQALRVPDAAVGAKVGAAVAMSGGALVAGAPDDDYPTLGGGHNNKQGSVTAFELFAAANDAYITDEGRTLTVAAPGVLSNDANPSGGALNADLVSPPAHGTLTLRSDGSFTYVPKPGSAAPTRSPTTPTPAAPPQTSPPPRSPSGRSRSPTQTATRPTRTRTCPSTPPTACLPTTRSGTGDPLTAVLVSGPAHGALTSALASDGSFTYKPDAGFFGQDTFTYRAFDGANDVRPGDRDDHRPRGAAAGRRADCGRRQLWHRPGHAAHGRRSTSACSPTTTAPLR